MGVISFLHLMLLPLPLALLCESNNCRPLIPSPSLDKWDNILPRASSSWVVPTTLEWLEAGGDPGSDPETV